MISYNRNENEQERNLILIMKYKYLFKPTESFCNYDLTRIEIKLYELQK